MSSVRETLPKWLVRNDGSYRRYGEATMKLLIINWKKKEGYRKVSEIPSFITTSTSSRYSENFAEKLFVTSKARSNDLLSGYITAFWKEKERSLERIVTGDEGFIHHKDSESKQNSKEWRHPGYQKKVWLRSGPQLERFGLSFLWWTWDPVDR